MGTASGLLGRSAGVRVGRVTTAPEARPPSMVERMTTIVGAFATRATRLSLEEVQDATGLPRSTAHRILNQLIALDWVRHTPAGYALGGRALGLGRAHEPDMDLRAAAAETLHSLHLETGLVVHLGVLEGGDVHILDKIGGAEAVRVPSRVGGRFPASWTSLGKAQLALLPPEEVDVLVGGNLLRAPGRARPDLASLHRELARARTRSGVVFERGDNDPRLGCVAAPVVGREGVCGAVSLVGGPGIDFEKLAPLLLRATRGIAARLEARLDAVPGRTLVG